MNILVTGSSGHLGEALVRTLRKARINHRGMDVKPSDFTTHVGSITDREFVRQALRDVDFVIHTATLHKPHVGTHSPQDFVDTNITGTLNLLQESLRQGVRGFIYTSTTSTFGDVLTPGPTEPAAWITESTSPIPKNIYGVTKSAAEDLCQLFYRNHRLPCLILKTSRFFSEEDDRRQVREAYQDLNVKALEYLYRRVDLEDAVSAHWLALEHVRRIGFRKYIISATSPFRQQDVMNLNLNAEAVVASYYPDARPLFAARGWKMFPTIDRVYVNERARRELGWKPLYDFSYVLDCLRKHQDFRSQLSLDVGVKGYHENPFGEGPYPLID